MNRFTKYVPCSLALLFALVFTLPQFAQTATPPPPAQIASAHSIFLSNAGNDPNFPIDSTQGYNDIYAALKAWGHYQLVNSPDQADLIFELHGVSPVTGVSGVDGNVSSYTSPAFQLVIRDPKNSAKLWTITSPVTVLGRNQTFARWVSLSETNLVTRIKVLAGQPLTATETSDLTTYPKYHTTRNGLILIGALVGFGVGGGLLMHHLYEDGLANQKAQQDAFCSAHGIPLSMCAGG